MAFKRKFSKRKFSKKSKRPVKRARKSMSTKKFAAAVKRVVVKTAEPKKHSFSLSKVDIKHNVPFTFLHINNAVTMPSQGLGDNERVGDQINTSGFTLKLIFGQFADRENVTWQLRVVSVPKGSGYVYNQWYDNVTNNVMLDDMNVDFVKVHKTYTFKTILSPDANNAEEFTFVKKLWIPYKKLLKFGPANAATTHNDGYDRWVIITAYDAYGTLATDNLGYVLGNVALHYRDP